MEFEQNSNDQPSNSNNNNMASINNNIVETNLRKIDINEQNNNSNFDIEYNNIIANFNSFKITPENNFHISHYNNKRFESSIGKRRHSFDEELLNKRNKPNISSYQPSHFTKRSAEESELYSSNKMRNIGQYYPNKSYKRNAELIDDFGTTNKKHRKNEVLNNLPVKRPGNNFENNNVKHRNLEDSYGEISNKNLDVSVITRWSCHN